MGTRNETKLQGEQSDAALLDRARAGDSEVLAALYEATYADLWHTVCALLKSEQDVMDVLQDTYVKAFTRLDSIEKPESLRPWLRQIAVNTARDHLRRRKPALFSELQSEEEQTLPEPEEAREEALPELALDRKETQRLVREMLDSLSDEQRLVIGMYYYQELPVREIAAQLGLPQNTVKSQLRYGRQKLEKRVRALEQQGVSLGGAAPIVFFRAMLRQGIDTTPVPEAASSLTRTVSRGGVRALQGGMRVKTITTAGLWAKRIAVGVSALAAAAGVTVGAGLLARHSQQGGDVRPSEVTESTEQLAAELTEPTEASEATTPTGGTEEAEPNHPPVHAGSDELDGVLQQLRDAALAAEGEEAALPDGLPTEAIRLLRERWAVYPDDEARLLAQIVDLDGDGGPEEIVYIEGYGEEQWPVCGIFSIQDGVLQSAGISNPTLQDEIEFYRDGCILQWKNGRGVTPGEVTVYRLSPQTHRAEVESVWSYSLSVGSWTEYTDTATGETLDGRDFYGRLNAYLNPFPYWTQVDTGEVDTVLVAENPGSDREATVNALEVRNPAIMNGLFLTRLPQIRLEGEGFEDFNEQMRQLAAGVEAEQTAGGEGMDFDWAVNGDILSVWTHTYYGGGYDFHKVYNFSISEARQISDNELLERLGVSRAAYDNAVLLGIHGKAVSLDHYSALHGNLEGMLAGFEQAIPTSAPDYVDTAQPTLDRNGRLIVFANVISIAGGSSYTHEIPLDGLLDRR